MKKLTLFVFGFAVIMANAQYKQSDSDKNQQVKIFPKQKFDSVAAKNALAYGKTTVKGVAFTKEKNALGFAPLMAERIYANHIMVELFPLTPYFQEWYDLKKTSENVKKNKIVYMDTSAYRQRLTCETNSKGEFTFPEMRPGKYIILGTLPWSKTQSYDKYTGSGYGNYGGRVDYYDRQYYTISHSDFLMQIIEVKEGDKEINVKLK